jgi:threonine dehydrogenase-like Zn-dependent dehydrogenase
VLSAVQVAAALGANVIGGDLDESKLALARQEGAAASIDASAGDVPTQVREITGGWADGIGGRAGHPGDDAELRELAAERGGIHVQIGVTSAAESVQVALPIDWITMNEIEFRGPLGNPDHHYDQMLGWYRPGSCIRSRWSVTGSRSTRRSTR